MVNQRSKKKKRKYKHIHIGTGRLGLGFCGYFSHDLGYYTVFLNRKSEISSIRNKKLAEQKEYIIKYYDNTKSEIIRLDELHVFDVESKETGLPIDLISDPNIILVTTAVGDSQLRYIAPIIANILLERSKIDLREPLFVLACENGHRCSQKLAQEVERCLQYREHVGVFADCVVDQICDRIEVPNGRTSPSSSVVISAESYREWVIENTDERLKKFLDHPSIKFVPESQIDLYELRKLWLINGFHLALAVLGNGFFKQAGIRISEVIMSTNEELLKQIKGIKTELSNALVFKDTHSVFKDKGKEIYGYINEVENRFKHSPDTCERILRDALLSEERITQVTRQFASDLGKDDPLSKVFSKYLYGCVLNFFRKVQDRLYDPIATLLSQGYTPIHLTFILQELVPFLVKQGDTVLSRLHSQSSEL